MLPTLDSNLSREVDGGGGLRRMFSCLGGAEMRGRDSMVVFCWGGTDAGVAVGF